MSVVVIGMEMPNTCEECKTSCEVGSDMHCLVTDAGNKWGWKLSESGFYSRPDWCPLRPLPEKHGRLIDAKDLEKMRFTDGINGEDCKLYVPFVEVAEAIFKCPTIVEAEGE